MKQAWMGSVAVATAMLCVVPGLVQAQEDITVTDKSFGCIRDGTKVRNTYIRSEEHTSELQSQSNLVCRLLLEKKKNIRSITRHTYTISFAPSASSQTLLTPPPPPPTCVRCAAASASCVLHNLSSWCACRVRIF